METKSSNILNNLKNSRNARSRSFCLPNSIVHGMEAAPIQFGSRCNAATVDWKCSCCISTVFLGRLSFHKIRIDETEQWVLVGPTLHIQISNFLFSPSKTKTALFIIPINDKWCIEVRGLEYLRKTIRFLIYYCGWKGNIYIYPWIGQKKMDWLV